MGYYDGGLASFFMDHIFILSTQERKMSPKQIGMADFVEYEIQDNTYDWILLYISLIKLVI